MGSSKEFLSRLGANVEKEGTDNGSLFDYTTTTIDKHSYFV
jgi:hypothetical protein